MTHCGVCGTALTDHDVEVCTTRQLDVDRYCSTCGRRLDVQVLPVEVIATCRRCDGIHPARRPPPDSA